MVIVSYRLGARCICEIESASARVAHSEGASREGAERQAIAAGSERLARTRVDELD